ncbi:MAG: cytochrome c biogenesis protein CcsA, partial [Planctomycetes bacterium]|nr:cytochrome c biogenesis protein CcsA [Planctomycetota bacterium]
EETRRTAIHNWALLHASLTVFGIAGVLLGIVLSLMYLVQHRRLKHKRVLSTGLTLPSLATLARWNRWAVIVSVPLLTLGLCTGVLLGLATRKTETPVSFADPFVVGVTFTWAVMFAFFLWLLRRQAPTSRRVAWLTVWAFGFMLVTMIGLQILMRGWIHSWHSFLDLPTPFPVV